MKKILIAEDSPVNRELLRELLEMQDFEVFEACNGQEALDMIGEIRPDLLVLDLGMPVLDGFGTISRIRADPKMAGLPVLAATAYAMRGDREKTLEAGFDGYISKPINPSALKQEIGRLLSSPTGEKTASAKAAG
jgi:CheY-like chemotaxis protein